MHASRIAPLALALCLVACADGGGQPGPAPAAKSAAEPVANAEVARPTSAKVGTDPGHAGAGTPLVAAAGHELAAFALGCFWGSENTFRHVPGVVATAVGYAGGRTEAPTYESVCTHTTGHAETVLVEFDPAKVTYEKLLSVFFASHDPTTKNRQGPDVGDQYRSAIFTFSDAQAAAARAAIAATQPRLPRPITTEVTPMPRFWIAEAYHQQYDEKTGRESCATPNAAEGT